MVAGEPTRPCTEQFAPQGSAPAGVFIGGKTPGPKAESGGRVLVEGQHPPPHLLGGLVERCELPSGILGGAPTAQRFSTIFSTQDVLS